MPHSIFEFDAFHIKEENRENIEEKRQADLLLARYCGDCQDIDRVFRCIET